MSLWIKICANTTLADAQVAADAGTDAVGFVFAPSPRQVTPEQVAAIAPHLPVSIEKFGVFVDADFAEIVGIVDQCGLTGVQLHSTGSGALPAQLRLHFGSRLRILQVVHFGENASLDLQKAAADPSIDAILIDSRTATAAGGTGLRFDWDAARDRVFSGRSPGRLIAAGGLAPANVAQAIATLNPWGIDVASGVESSPGRKDPQKVREFIANARAAALAQPAPVVQRA
jgi:phosphoribosylanthranilate isomerase